MLRAINGVYPARGRGAVYPSSRAPWVSGVLVLKAFLAGLLLSPSGGFLLLLEPFYPEEPYDLLSPLGSFPLHPFRRGRIP